MKKNIILLFAVSVVAGKISVSSQNLPERIMNLDDCFYYAQRNNSDILNAQEEIILSQQRLREAMSQIYPRMDLIAAASRYESTNLPSLPAVFPEAGPSWILDKRYPGQEYFVRFAVQQPIYASGRIKTNVTLARTKLSQTESELEIVRNQIFYKIKDFYYQVLALQKEQQLYDEEIKFIDSLRKRPEAKNYSVSLELDKYQMDIQHKSLDTRYNLEEKKLSLLKLVGLELNTVFSLKGELTQNPTDYNLNILLANAYRWRPELKQTQFAQTVDQLQLNLTFSQRFPTVFLSGSYDFSGADFPLGDKNWSASMIVTLPIFDGWATFARIAQQQSYIREGKIKKVHLEDQIASEVRQAYLSYRKSCELLVLVKREREMLEEISLPAQPNSIEFLNYLNYRQHYIAVNVNYYEALAQLSINHSRLFSVVNLDEKNN